MVDEAKSRTQVAQLTTALVVVVVLLFLTKPLQYLPEAVLSAVVFLIGLKLIAIKSMREIQRLRIDEFVVACITALVVVTVGVEQGIVLAIILSLILHVRRHYEPNDLVISWDSAGHMITRPASPPSESEPGLVIYRFGVGLFYANAERLSEEVLALVSTPDPPRWFVLDVGAMDDLDYTGGKTLAETAEQVKNRGIVFAVAEATPKLRAELDRFGVTETIGADHIYDTIQEAVEAFRGASQ
jgi:MFS superfamily sulfate permease-like transporter